MKKNRSCESGWWVVLLTASLAAQVLAQDGAGLFDSKLKQVITSSTLKWSSLKKEVMDTYVIGAESQQGPIYLCRAKHEGDMILGQLRPPYASCAVSGSKSYDVFDVLQNPENASLVTWNPWLKFASKPTGGVLVDSSVDSVFIGRTKAASGFSHNIGRIIYETTGKLLTFDDKNNDVTETNGEILVEVEPVSYNLDNVELNVTTEHVRSLDSEIYGERVLQNDAEFASKVTTEFEYEFNYTVSWGHGHGIAIGLNTTITMADGTVFPQIEWANPFTETKKTQLYKLEKFLEPGTACNVTFKGKRIERDIQYTGKLTTFYNNHDPRSRQIRGTRTENTLEVEAIYGEIYFLGNFSLVPTTTTTTTTTTTITTTTQAPTIATEPESNNVPFEIVKPKPENIGTNTNNLVDEQIEKAQAPKQEQNIKNAMVGTLDSAPGGASRNILSFTLFVPLFALLL